MRFLYFIREYDMRRPRDFLLVPQDLQCCRPFNILADLWRATYQLPNSCLLFNWNEVFLQREAQGFPSVKRDLLCAGKDTQSLFFIFCKR